MYSCNFQSAPSKHQRKAQVSKVNQTGSHHEVMGIRMYLYPTNQQTIFVYLLSPMVPSSSAGQYKNWYDSQHNTCNDNSCLNPKHNTNPIPRNPRSLEITNWKSATGPPHVDNCADGCWMRGIFLKGVCRYCSIYTRKSLISSLPYQ